LIFSYSSKGSMFHVMYCFLDAMKLIWSSEKYAFDNTYHRDILYQISSAYFKKIVRRFMCGICIMCLLYGPRTKNRLSNMPAHTLDKLFLRITYILALFPMFYSMQFLGASPVLCSPTLDLRA